MLTGQERAEIEKVTAQYDHKRAAAMEALLIVQRRSGWVSDEDLKETAELLGLSPAELENVATFYNLILRREAGRHIILLCDSISCWICGCRGIAQGIEARLGITFGETTADRRFTLLPIACLGACDHAPVMIVDRDTFTDLTPADIPSILERYP